MTDTPASWDPVKHSQKHLQALTIITGETLNICVYMNVPPMDIISKTHAHMYKSLQLVFASL